MNSQQTCNTYRSVAFKCVGLIAISFCGCASLSTGFLDRSERPSTLAKIDSENLSRAERANVCLQTGLSLAAHQKDDHAILQLKKARDLNPKRSGIAHPLAVLYDRKGQFGLAEQEYQRAMSDGKPSPSLLNDFGYFRYVQGRLDEAKDLLERAIALSPEDNQAKVNLAMAHAASEDYESAYELFRSSVGPAAAHQNIGLILLRSGQEEQAIAHLQQATTIDPSLQAATTMLAMHTDAAATSQIQAVSFEK
ncbi:MAG: tetratricopeptide repeat protein [Fuerstiella sp.]